VTKPSHVIVVGAGSGVTLAPMIGEFAAIEILDGIRVDQLQS